MTTIPKATRVLNVDFQLLLAERDDLLEAEIGYKKRIEKLEKEATDALKSFDILYNENRILRSKLDTPDGTGVDSVESYNSVFKDREHLREANRAFKRRIRQLEDDIEQQQKKYADIYSKHQLVTQKAQLETEFATRAKNEKIQEMEKEHEEIEERLKMFLKEREQYEYKVAEMDKERNELQNKYDQVVEERHEFQLRCDVLKEDREKLKEKVANLEDKIPDPEQKAKEEQQYLSLQAQVVALQIANTDAAKQIHNLREEIRELDKLKKEKVEMIDRSLSVLVDEETLKEERSYAEKLNGVTLELEEVKKRSYYIISENDRLKYETTELQLKLTNNETIICELKQELEENKEQLEELSATARGNENLNEEYLALLEKNKDITAMNTVLENDLVQEKKVAKLRMLELNNKLDIVTEELHQTEKDKFKLESECQHIQSEHSTQQKVIEAQTSELRNMKAQIEQIQAMLEEKSLKYEEMKKIEKEAQSELRESRVNLHVTRHELDNLKIEKAGHFSSLKKEMESAKDERKEESEQMRQETIRLREEVKKLKDYEFKITTMDSEIRRLMNRLRMSERFRKFAKKPEKVEIDKGEISELKRRQKELEKENSQLSIEKRQWEILKKKYGDLQLNNRRLQEENKRIRGDLDDTYFKVDTLEKRCQKLNVKVGNEKVESFTQQAVYVDKSPEKSRHVAPLKMLQSNGAKDVGILGISTKRGIKPSISKQRKKYERKTSKLSSGKDILSHMKSKKPVLPEVAQSRHGNVHTKSYKDLHLKTGKGKDHLSLL